MGLMLHIAQPSKQSRQMGGPAPTIPVSCVEQGRWSYRGRRFASSDYALYASMRARKLGRVSQSLRERRGHDADQGEVWNELAEKAAFLRAESPRA